MNLTARWFALRSTPPFDALRVHELLLLAEATSERRYLAGERVCGPERPLNALHVVVEGVIQDDRGRPLPHLIGLEALLFDRPIAGALHAAPPEGVRCLLLPRSVLHTLVHECPALLAGWICQEAA